MSDEPSDIKNLDEEQINRLITADWLESIAKLIRTGSAVGFDIAWDSRYHKPMGNVVMSTEQLYGAVEMKLIAAKYEAAKQALASKIAVQDLSEEIKDHSCTNEECLVCSNRKNEQKS